MLFAVCNRANVEVLNRAAYRDMSINVTLTFADRKFSGRSPTAAQQCQVARIKSREAFLSGIELFVVYNGHS